ncbi:MAG: hypothetical protein R3252_08355 [Robiginitalea sp.]|nr:hypothetical protein [Robiginitalea sp.]
MGRKNSKKGFNKYNFIAALVLLAFVAFLLISDPLSWMEMMQVKLLIGGVILIVLIITLRSLYKRGR